MWFLSYFMGFYGGNPHAYPMFNPQLGHPPASTLHDPHRWAPGGPPHCMDCRAASGSSLSSPWSSKDCAGLGPQMAYLLLGKPMGKPLVSLQVSIWQKLGLVTCCYWVSRRNVRVKRSPGSLLGGLESKDLDQSPGLPLICHAFGCSGGDLGDL